jgi:hypothetical protein
MSALFPYQCSCGARALVAFGEATPTSLMTALEVSERLETTLMLVGSGDPRCPTCDAAYEAGGDDVGRMVERLATAETADRIPARN